MSFQELYHLYIGGNVEFVRENLDRVHGYTEQEISRIFSGFNRFYELGEL